MNIYIQQHRRELDDDLQLSFFFNQPYILLTICCKDYRM